MSVIQSILQCHFPFFFCHINFAWFSLVLHPCRLFRLLNSLVAWISVCSVTIIHSLVLSWLLSFCSVNKYALCKNKTNLQYGFVKLQRTCFHCFPHSRFDDYSWWLPCPDNKSGNIWKKRKRHRGNFYLKTFHYLLLAFSCLCMFILDFRVQSSLNWSK